MTNEQLAAICTVVTVLGGGVVTFFKWAFTQWLRDRKEEREERRGEVAALFDIQLTLAAMLERDRRRDEVRRRRESDQPPSRDPSAVLSEWGGNTDVHEIKRGMQEAQLAERRDRGQRKPTPIAGIRSPRPGTHHDE